MKNTLLTLFVAAIVGLACAVQSGCSATATRPSTGEYIDDTAITAKVKAALFRDDTVKGFDVHVETSRSVVQLSGFVDTETQRMRAEEVARTIAGVTDVVNDIQLKPLPANR